MAHKSINTTRIYATLTENTGVPNTENTHATGTAHEAADGSAQRRRCELRDDVQRTACPTTEPQDLRAFLVKNRSLSNDFDYQQIINNLVVCCYL